MSSVLEMVRPSWADPAYSLATNGTRVTNITVGATGIAKILGNDPTRWSFGVVSGRGDLAAALLQPHGCDPNTGFAVNGTASDSWFDLFRFGPLVTGEWTIAGVPNTTITVIETYLLWGV